MWHPARQEKKIAFPVVHIPEKPSRGQRADPWIWKHMAFRDTGSNFGAGVGIEG